MVALGSEIDGNLRSSTINLSGETPPVTHRGIKRFIPPDSSMLNAVTTRERLL
jgi:hypothetical protein